MAHCDSKFNEISENTYLTDITLNNITNTISSTWVACGTNKMVKVLLLHIFLAISNNYAIVTLILPFLSQ